MSGSGGQGSAWSHLLDDEDERYSEPAFFEHVSLRSRPKPHRAHPDRDRSHPPLFCPAPRINEPLRGYRCPACARRIHHEASVWDAQAAADRALATIGRALAAAFGLVRDLPRWAEITVGLVLTVFPVLGWLAANGWIRGMQ